MGSLIGFYSPRHGCGVSANMLAISAYLSGHDVGSPHRLFRKQEKTERLPGRDILIMQTHTSTMNNLDYPILGRIYDSDAVKDKGLEALIYKCSADGVTQKIIADNVIDISEHLHLLTGTQTDISSFFANRNNRACLAQVLMEARRTYDVCIDIGAGTSEITREMLKMCDTIVITVRQDPMMIQSCFGPAFEDKKVVYCVGEYQDKSRYNLKNLQRKSGLAKGSIVGIPYSLEYRDALTAGKAKKYLLSELATPREKMMEKAIRDAAIACVEAVKAAGRQAETKAEAKTEAKDTPSARRAFRELLISKREAREADAQTEDAAIDEIEGALKTQTDVYVSASVEELTEMISRQRESYEDNLTRFRSEYERELQKKDCELQKKDRELQKKDREIAELRNRNRKKHLAGEEV